jgi:DNA-binding protein
MINFIKLKDIREDHDISQKEMANILGVTRSAYSLWELGINIIPLKPLVTYANYFNYSIDYVLGLTNDRRKNNVTPELDLKVLGNNIKNLRIKNELSQENLANILGVTQACITRYEKGLVCISTSNLYNLSKEFRVSISYLCGKNN